VAFYSILRATHGSPMRGSRFPAGCSVGSMTRSGGLRRKALRLGDQGVLQNHAALLVPGGGTRN